MAAACPVNFGGLERKTTQAWAVGPLPASCPLFVLFLAPVSLVSGCLFSPGMTASLGFRQRGSHGARGEAQKQEGVTGPRWAGGHPAPTEPSLPEEAEPGPGETRVTHGQAGSGGGAVLGKASFPWGHLQTSASRTNAQPGTLLSAPKVPLAWLELLPRPLPASSSSAPTIGG